MNERTFWIKSNECILQGWGETKKNPYSYPGGSNMCLAFIFSWGNMSFDKRRCVSITRQLYVIQGKWYDIVHRQWAQAGISEVPNALDELPLESSHYPFCTSRVLMYRGLTQHCSVRSSIYDIESASKLDTEWSFLKINVQKKKKKPLNHISLRQEQWKNTLCCVRVLSSQCFVSYQSRLSLFH